jgi:peroxiredoxin
LVAATVGQSGAHTHQHAEPVPEPAQLEVGDLAPEFHLHGLADEHVTEHALRGQLSVVVFWDPMCAFCQDLLPELRAQEANVRDSGVHLLFVTIGSEDANRAQGFTSTVVLDDNSRVTRSFGAYGTPMARLVDADGRIASELAAGAPEVLALLDRATTVAGIAGSLARG